MQNLAKLWQILAKKLDFRAVQRSALCRSRRELSHAYLVAKFGFDTASRTSPLKFARSSRVAGFPEAGPTSQRAAGPAAKPAYLEPMPLATAPTDKIDRARSRVYRSQILQPKHRWKALDAIYKFRILLVTLIFKISQNFKDFRSNFCRKYRQNFVKDCENSENFQ